VTRPLDARQLDACVEGCAATHQKLLAAVDGLGDTDFSAPSKLPGWSRATLVGHLALNARSHLHLLECAARGESGEQYPGGPGARERAIEEISTWSRDALVKELRSAVYALEGAWAGASRDAWVGTGTLASGAVVAMHELPFLRWRESVVHLTDLDVGAGWETWPSLYVRLELERQKMAWAASHAMGLTQLPRAALKLSENERLAWLLQRTDVEGLPRGLGF
jgi:maleylpyruvate isomerase